MTKAKTRTARWWAALAVPAAFLAAGCPKADEAGKVGAGGTTKAALKSGPAAHHDDHPDKGPHGGALAEWGEEEYHVEFTVDHKAQQATVYVLDGHAAKAKPIAAEQLTLALKTTPPVTMTLTANPQAGDPAGRSSRFVAKVAVFGKEQDFAGTVSGEAGGKPYAGDFTEKEHDHGKD